MRIDDPGSMRMALCPTCGNKRCPRAHNHTLACTNSNEPGQPGSSWEHVQPMAPAPRPTNPYGCHNRAPTAAPDCQYTLSALGQKDARCTGCRWRVEKSDS